MSKKEQTEEELTKELEALDADMKKKRQAMVEKRTEVRLKDLKKAEEKTFTEKETANLKAVFGRFDKDNSGSISLQELQLIAKELGTVMPDDDAKAAMEELDVNKDGMLNFEEFVKWWASDSKRGGNKGLLLDLVKAKIMAEMVQKQVAAVMRDTATKKVELGSEQTSVRLDVVAGDISGGVFGSNISLYALPFSRSVLQSEFDKMGAKPKDGYVPLAMVTIDFNARSSASDADLKDTASALNDVLQQIVQGAELCIDIQATLTALPEERVLRFRAYVSAADGQTDPLQSFASDMLGTDPKGVEELTAKAIDSLSASMSFVTNLSEYFGFNKKVKMLRPLTGVRLQASGKLTRSVVEFAQIVSLPVSAENFSSETKQAHMALTAIEMLQQVNASVVLSSVEEVIHKIIRAVCATPVKIAASRNAPNYDVVVEECLKLQESILKIYDETAGTYCLGDVWLADMHGLPADEELKLVALLADVVEGITVANVITPYIAAKFSSNNVPFFDFAKGMSSQDKVMAVREEALSRLMPTKESVEMTMASLEPSLPAVNEIMALEGLAENVRKVGAKVAKADS